MTLVLPVMTASLDSEVCVSFGRAPYFLEYHLEEQSYRFVENDAASQPGGAGIHAAQLVVDLKAEVLLTPRCGENAAEVLVASDVKIFKTDGNAILDNIEAYKKGVLKPLEEIHKGHGGH